MLRVQSVLRESKAVPSISGCLSRSAFNNLKASSLSGLRLDLCINSGAKKVPTEAYFIRSLQDRLFFSVAVVPERLMGPVGSSWSSDGGEGPAASPV